MIYRLKKRFAALLLTGAVIFTSVFGSYGNAMTVRAALPAAFPVIATLAAVVGVSFTGEYFKLHKEELVSSLENFAERIWNETSESLTGTIHELPSWSDFVREVGTTGVIKMSSYGVKLFMENFAKGFTYEGVFPDYGYMDYIKEFSDTYPYYFVISNSASGIWSLNMLTTPMHTSVTKELNGKYSVSWGPVDDKVSFGALYASPSGYRIQPSGGGGVTSGAFILAASVAISMPFLDGIGVEDFMDTEENSNLSQKVDDLDTSLSDVIYGTTNPAGDFVEEIPVVDSGVWDEVISGDKTWDDVITDSGITVIDPATDTTLVGEDVATDVPGEDVENPSVPVAPEFPTWIPSGLKDIFVDLQRVFPFCIPFDVANLVRVLSAQPEAPHFKYTLNVDTFDYTYTFDINLSKFDSVALVCRRVILVLFIAGLAVVTRKLIRG